MGVESAARTAPPASDANSPVSPGEPGLPFKEIRLDTCLAGRLRKVAGKLFQQLAVEIHKARSAAGLTPPIVTRRHGEDVHYHY